MARNPYPNFRGDYAAQLHALHYPSFIQDLVYHEHDEESGPKSESLIWQHPLIGSDQRLTGHDIHRYLLDHGMFDRTVSFHNLRHHEVFPKTIPEHWYGYSYILGWKGVGIDKNGDWWVPALYMKTRPTPKIHWILLSMVTNAGEATLIEHED